MGVPAFFRWLTRKYPSVVVECVEESLGEDGTDVDSSKPNPNGVEFDNFYLDMNGIIHPCTHPENKPPPKDEDEMMVAIFECIDRLFKIIRPRKVLYMAIDGVAPRAKMNQQRSRRFRAAKETIEKHEQIEKVRTEMEARGIPLPALREKGATFDSNCITPGTEFMARLTECLNFYIHDRLMSDPGWKGLKVILSDASVPGEGEHKIMDFIRRQRSLPGHDPNTHHCLCGADADLIMLGLATHEPNFTIIREEFLMNQPKRCDICGKTGHELKDCKGLESIEPELMLDGPPVSSGTKYIFVRLNVLREYLEDELSMPNLPFKYDFERALDDWVFMCFFVGNDFLPHLPSLEIREGAIDRLITLYKKTVYRTGGFLTDSGDVKLDRVQYILTDLGEAEDEIFRKRQRNEINFKMRNKQRDQQGRSDKSYAEMMSEIESEDAKDGVRLWEAGYKDRYYKLKFNLQLNDLETRYRIGQEYVLGLSWVLKYYYQGCCSWDWYFPFHYAPFASDIVNIASCDISFAKKSEPFSPLEQLMSVFPAASGHLVPKEWANLMIDPLSPILDFYPKDFMIDLNGKKYAWQGVALLPFVDEKRLKRGLESVYDTLTEDEILRNSRGHDRLYANDGSDCFEFVRGLTAEFTTSNKTSLSSIGITGQVFIDTKNFFQGVTLSSPIPGLRQVDRNSVICVHFNDPAYPRGHKFLANRLEGARDPPRTLRSGQNRGGPLIGFVPRTDKAYLGNAGHRFLRHELPPNHNYIPIGKDRNQRGYHSGGPIRNDNRYGNNFPNHPYQQRPAGPSYRSQRPPYNPNQNRNSNWYQGRSQGHRYPPSSQYSHNPVFITGAIKVETTIEVIVIPSDKSEDLTN